MSRAPADIGYALVLERPHRLRLRDRPTEGVLADRDALIQSMYVAVCGTDLEVIDSSSDRVRPPVILGHEWAGRVAAVGAQVDPSVVGAFVVGENIVDGREVGFELPGGLASHFTVPAENLHRLPPFLHAASACLIEPLAVSVRAIRAAGLQSADSVLVIGDGVIGLFLARAASLTTDRLMLIGRHNDRLHIARELGVQSARLQKDFESDAAVRQGAWTVVFEASGKVGGLSTALAAAGDHARVVLLGDYGGTPVPVDATAVVRKELHITGSNASQGAWDEAVRLASSRLVDLGLVSQLVVPIDRWPEALEAARERHAVRVVLRHRGVE